MTAEIRILLYDDEPPIAEAFINGRQIVGCVVHSIEHGVTVAIVEINKAKEAKNGKKE